MLSFLWQMANAKDPLWVSTDLSDIGDPLDIYHANDQVELLSGVPRTLNLESRNAHHDPVHAKQCGRWGEANSFKENDCKQRPDSKDVRKNPISVLHNDENADAMLRTLRVVTNLYLSWY